MRGCLLPSSFFLKIICDFFTQFRHILVNMKKTLIIALLFSAAFFACSTENKQENDAKTTELLEIEEELDATVEEIEAETEDLKHDVDSLLEGI